MLVLGIVLIGLGSVPAKIAGPTYMNEIFTQKKYGIAISVVFLGSFKANPVALILGGIFLQFYVTLNPAPGLTVDSNEWVGAWWMGLLFPAIFLFILGLIISLYPRQMPAAKKVLEEKIARGITTVKENREERSRSMREIAADFVPALMRCLKNKALMCMIAAETLTFLRLGEFNYDPKIYMELYRLNSDEVGRALGFSEIVGCLLGFTASGLIMKIKRWQPKTLQLIVSIISLATVPFSLQILLYCPTGMTAGVDVSYSQLLNFSRLEPPSLTGACNSDCHCDTTFYEPVCDGSVTYFSPCHAGCRGVEKTRSQVTSFTGHVTYTNCTCTPAGTVTSGECGEQCPKLLITSMTLAVFAQIINMATTASLLYSSNRVVNEMDRTFSLGLKTCLVNLLGFIPAATIFGWIIDNYCTIWRENRDGTTGNCWAYDVENLVICFACVRIALTLSGTGLRFLAWWWYPDRHPDQAPAEEIDGLVGDHVQDVTDNGVDSQEDKQNLM